MEEEPLPHALRTLWQKNDQNSVRVVDSLQQQHFLSRNCPKGLHGPPSLDVAKTLCQKQN